MKEIENVLEKLEIKYEIGHIDNEEFIPINIAPNNKKAIKIQWKKEAIKKLTNKLLENNITIELLIENNYYGIYRINNTDNQLLIEYIVNSHVQLPHLLLKNFRTEDKLYYINPKNNEIKQKSARKYNTELGYYPKWFEEYLSNNYENIISELIITIEPFAKREINEIELEKLDEKINKLFFMALFRNPDEIKKINKESYTSILINGGIKPEDIALTCEEIATDILKNYKPILIVNTLEENFITIKCLFSGLSFKDNNSLIAPLHPKFGIIMIPKEKYKELTEKHGKNTYIVVDKIELLNKINQNIYHSALVNNTDIIGKEKDLKVLLNQLPY